MRFTRQENELREIIIQNNQSRYAEGSCSFKTGFTHAYCTASIEEKVPPFLRNKGTGWVTAEYSMLPRATHKRSEREITKGKISGRSQEIQRLIGRVLRMPVNTSLMGERQIIIDCDIITADGGTRTASINGGFHAMYLAFQKLIKQGTIKQNPIHTFIGAISVGVSSKNTILLDIDYDEDSSCIADANFILDEKGNIIEVQTACEDNTPLSKEIFDKMFLYAQEGISSIIKKQKEILL